MKGFFGMSAESDIVSISVTTATAGVTQIGFGEPAILSANASYPELVRHYSSADSILDDGISSTDPEYLMAQAIMAQTPHPDQFALLRRPTAPTQEWYITVLSAADHVTYSLLAGDTLVSIDSGTSGDNDSIVDALIDALNGSSVETVLPAGWAASAQGGAGAKYIRVIGSEGSFLSLSVKSTALLSVEQVQTDTTVEDALVAANLEDSSWYAVLNPFSSYDSIKTVSAWANAVSNKMYLADSADTPIINDALSGATDIAAYLKVLSADKTALVYSPIASEFAASAWAGRCLPLLPGSENWAFKTLVGVSPAGLTDTQRTNLKAKRCNWYSTVGGLNLTSPTGYTFKSWVDQARGIDWLKARLSEATINLFANNDKIAQTDSGIQKVASTIRVVLETGIAQGLLSSIVYLTVPKAADVSDADKAARALTGIKAKVLLAGAWNSVALSINVALS
jgi:hypothetical protein